jgi:hypothetical protein
MTTRVSDSLTQLPDSTTLAVERTRLADERTLMAWVRTSTSLISFGFTRHDRRHPGGRPRHPGVGGSVAETVMSTSEEVVCESH